MNRLLLVRFLPLAVIAVLLLFGYFFTRLEQDLNSGVQCQLLGLKECVLVIDQQEFVVQMLQPFHVEEELPVKLTFPSQYRLTGSWIQGVNMYMGKTALLPKNSVSDGAKVVSELTFFLGACSEDKMKWQLVLIYLNPVSGEEQKLFYNFSTDNSA